MSIFKFRIIFDLAFLVMHIVFPSQQYRQELKWALHSRASCDRYSFALFHNNAKSHNLSNQTLGDSTSNPECPRSFANPFTSTKDALVTVRILHLCLPLNSLYPQHQLQSRTNDLHLQLTPISSRK
jgi:hypothetical protein